MNPTELTFLESLSPATRKVLVSERLAAMRGRQSGVYPRLRALIAATPSENHADLAALGLLWSELLHLDRQDTEALSVFKDVVEPRQASLPVPVQLVATDNLSVLQMGDSLEEGVTTFYHFVDRRRVAQFEATESETLLAAQTALEKDRFPEALPLLWQNLMRAYSLGSWRASRWASERLAKLYLKAGAFEQCCHYLLVAEADKEMEGLAVAAAHRGDPLIIRNILRRLMNFANLRRHFTVACTFIARIPDLIPDAEVVKLAEWLLPRCREPADFNGGGAMRSAWEAMRELGHRLPMATSRKVLEAALTHPEWLTTLPGGDRVLPNRKVMVEAVTFLTHSAGADSLPLVVEATLPLATERVQDYDYGAVVNLLCNLGQLGDKALQTRIKTALFVPGKPLNRILAQVSGIFELEALTAAQWEGFANKVVDEIRLTVQRLKPGESAKPVAESLMTMTQTIPTGQLQVTVQTGAGLHALSKGIQHLSDASVGKIVQAIVEMATHRDNLLSNREFLLSQLCEFAARVAPELSDEIVRTLEPLARGDVPESGDYPSSGAQHHPLASARMNTGTPQQVQAMALVAAATFCGSDATRSRLIGEVLVEGFVSPHVTVRCGAYAAARRLPGLSSEQLLPILMGLRDSDPTAAVTAFAAFAERKEWSLTRPMWKLLILAARLASQSPEPNLRRHAAVLLHRRIDQAPTASIRTEVESILKLFGTDIAFSVREYARA